MDLADLDWTRTGWLLVGLALAIVLLGIFYSFIGTIVFAIFIYYVTRRSYTRIRRQIGQPTVAAVTSLLLLALPVILLLGYTVAIGLQEFSGFVSTANVTSLGPWSDSFSQYANVSAAISDPGMILEDPRGVEIVRSIVETGLSYLGFVGGILINLFIMLAVSFYLLRDGPRLGRWARQFADDQGVFEAYMTAVDHSLERIFYGNLLNAILTGGIGAIAYSVLDLFGPASVSIPYPAVMGLLAGLASLIPVVGMKLVYVPLLGYLGYEAFTVGTGWWFVATFFAISFVIVDTIPDFLIRPYVSKGDLHIGLLMLAYVFGPLLFGWYGIFLGPVLLVFIVHFARIVLPELVAEKTLAPYGVDPSYLTDDPEPVSDESSDATDASTGETSS